MATPQPEHRMPCSPPKSPHLERSESSLPTVTSPADTVAALAAAGNGPIGPHCFKRLKLLGRGDVGRVYLVQLIGTDKCFAMKVLPKKEMIARNKVKRVQTEREILATANHPFIVTLHWSFQSSNCLYFVMSFCGGGEFFRHLQSQPGRFLPEPAARFYAVEVLLALEYLHMMGFIYRDLKPENILMTSSGHIVLTDFDLSKGSAVQMGPSLVKKMFGAPKIHTEPGIVTNSFVGTEEYIAPEVIRGFGHTSSVDWWTFGILLFEMLFGTTPFRGRSRDETFGHILDCEIKFPDAPQVSKQCKDLVKHLLTPDSQKRLGATHGACEIKQHAWFKGINWNLVRNDKPPIVPQLTTEYDTRYFPELVDDDMLDKLELEAQLAQQRALAGHAASRADANMDVFSNFDTSKSGSSAAAAITSLSHANLPAVSPVSGPAPAPSVIAPVPLNLDQPVHAVPATATSPRSVSPPKQSSPEPKQ